MLTVFLEIEMEGAVLGWLTVELYDEIFPTAAAHFNALCDASPFVTKSGRELSYKDSQIFRIIPGFMVQGGDIISNDGMSATTIEDGQECFTERGVCRDALQLLSHDRRGLLCTATKGTLDTNNSQFYITLGPCPWQDGRDIIFGSVVSGYHILANLECLGTPSGAIQNDQYITISNCGNLTLKQQIEPEVTVGRSIGGAGPSRKILPLRQVVRRFINEAKERTEREKLQSLTDPESDAIRGSEHDSPQRSDPATGGKDTDRNARNGDHARASSRPAPDTRSANHTSYPDRTDGSVPNPLVCQPQDLMKEVKAYCKSSRGLRPTFTDT
ncbi:peptidyl-prolyl cis-trans isomerase, cyclophilin-type [Gregarina niphandrodes]|uniref:Peptidyl-prolyl cis-trans isomerase, cyclophilin-type n=1 Tax=Gregarina niphandrodes TaxID=110365 RepID=A0A023B992_GRENI|nr:peptidyl-prolyl cis-trans isomerase, cyclophilin-type [Gregarina niphandrodes]EZG71571.1 peptidyl-prolyl cis-trans isomerase, cyclophilin-type [Gregarina niphandrodes]|eukprot:XP_011129816.1 peptidyl-prolyl cis-trans isomerase, cyclophilin-type [Gregarina niphandrodes]